MVKVVRSESLPRYNERCAGEYSDYDTADAPMAMKQSGAAPPPRLPSKGKDGGAGARPALALRSHFPETWLFSLQTSLESLQRCSSSAVPFSSSL